jgi:hypothetical protein
MNQERRKITAFSLGVLFAGTALAVTSGETESFIPGLSAETAQQTDSYKFYKDNPAASKAYLDGYMKVLSTGEFNPNLFLPQEVRLASGEKISLNPCPPGTPYGCDVGANAAISAITSRLIELCGGDIQSCDMKKLAKAVSPKALPKIVDCINSWRIGYSDIGAPHCYPGSCFMPAEDGKNPEHHEPAAAPPRIEKMLSCATAGFELATSSCSKIHNAQVAREISKSISDILDSSDCPSCHLHDSHLAKPDPESQP